MSMHENDKKILHFQVGDLNIIIIYKLKYITRENCV